MRDYIEYLAFRFVSAVASRLSFPSVHRFGSLLGSLVFDLTGIRKNVTLENIRNSLPELAPEEVTNIARGAYRNYGISVCEMLWATNKSADALKSVVHPLNREVFDAAHAMKKGVILLSAHFGGWEMMLLGLPLQLGVPALGVAQEQRNALVDALVTRGRSRFGNRIVYMEKSVREVIKTLHAGGAVVILGDQSAPKESVFVDFFGRPAATHRGTAVFSLKTGAPIVLVLHIRRPDGRYNAQFELVDQTGLTGYSEENVVELTRRHTALLEKHIRLHLDHWLWMHKRWKHTEYYQSLQVTGTEKGIA